jgi:hypothetical protein
MRVTFSYLFVGAAVVFLAAAALFARGVVAQDLGIITPTLAPTKTPLPPTETPSAEFSTVSTNATVTRSNLTQSDLSVLTGNVQRPNGIVWHEGQLYTACTGDWTLYQLDAITGQTATYIWGVRNAHSLYAETTDSGDLNLWVPDFQANTLNRVTRNGVQPILTEMAGPWGIAYLDATHFFVSNLLGDNVSLVERSGTQRTVVSGLVSPTGLARDEVYLYIANNGSTRRAIEWIDIREVITPGSAEVQPLPLVSGLQNTTGMVMGSDGNLYFAFSLGSRGVVGRVDPVACREQGGCTAEDVEIVVLTELAAPLAGLAISPDMRLYVHTMFSPDIYWVQL